jgi:hypothetical protein
MITANGLIQLGFAPDIDFSLQDDSDGRGTYIAEWLSDKPQPTEAEIETAHVEWQSEFDATEYARLREADYPNIQDCLHAILDDDLEALQVKRQEVKNRYPKP